MMFKHYICVAVAAVGLMTALPVQASVHFGAASGPLSTGVRVEASPVAVPSAARAPQWAQRQISARDAKSIAQRQVPGAKVVDVSRTGNKYRVRLIKNDGRVVDVYVDANTGRVTN